MSKTLPETEELSQRFIKAYLNEVVRPVLPEATFGSYGYSVKPENIPYPIEGTCHRQQFIYAGTPFYLFHDKKKFIHYTKLQSFSEILSSKQIRLYDFSNFDDPSEFGQHAKLKEMKFMNNEFRKSNLLAFSFNESIEEDFNMWRLYGDNGHGVAFEFEFLGDEEQQRAWNNYYLSRVHYNNDSNQTIEIFIENHNNFIEKHHEYQPTGTESFILPLIGFIKKEIYKNESEIRLLTLRNNFFNENDNRPDYHIGFSKQKKLVNFTSIPISDHESYFKIINSNDPTDFGRKAFKPHVTITKVILGYRYNKTDANELRLQISQVLNYYKYNQADLMNIERSSLVEHFEENDKVASVSF